MKQLCKFMLLFAVALFACFGLCACAKTYTVTFMSDDETVATQTIMEKGKVLPYHMEVAEGLKLEGWYTDSEYANAYDFETEVGNNLTLYAKIVSLNYTVTYNLGGAEGTAPTQDAVKADGTFTLPTTLPLRIGYEFLGWSDGNEIYAAGANYSVDGATNVVLTAIWQYKTVTVSFVDDKGNEIIGYTAEIPYGGAAYAPSSEEVPHTYFAYKQVSWDKPTDIVTEDTVFTAEYEYVPSPDCLFEFKITEDYEGWILFAKDSLSMVGNIALPKEHDGMPVTEIGAKAFYKCWNMEGVHIPSSYNIVRYSAFVMTYLQTISIEEGLTTIEQYSGLIIADAQNVILPSTLSFIQPRAFDGIFVWLNEGLSVSSIIIDNSEDNASFDNIQMAEGGYYRYDNLTGIIYGNEDKEIVFVHPYAEEVVIKQGVETLYPDLFVGQRVELKITIDADLAFVGSGAFANSNIKELIINGSMGILEGNDTTEWRGVKYAFTDNMPTFAGVCLEKIVFPEGLKFIGAKVFYRCSIEEIKLPSSIEYIAPNAFESTSYGSDISKIIIAENDYYYVDQNAALIQKARELNEGETLLSFCKNSPLTSYAVPSTVTNIIPWAFAYNENLTSLTLPEGLIAIPSGMAYRAVSLTSVNIPASVLEFKDADAIGYSLSEKGAFYDCTNLSTVSFAENSAVSEIPSFAFYNIGCVTFDLPASVKRVGTFAIWGRNLTDINVSEENQSYCDVDGVLFTKDMNTLLVYPYGRTATEYSIPNEVEIIAEYAFSKGSFNYDNIPTLLERVILGLNVKTIEVGAFYGMKYSRFDETTEESVDAGLKNVVINPYLTSIQHEAFYDCKCLESVTFTSTQVPTLGSNVFSYGIDLIPNLEFSVPEESILDYFEVLYRCNYTYVQNFDEEILPTISYSFDLNIGGLSDVQTIDDVMIAGLIVPEIDYPDNFWGWYLLDGSVDGEWGEQVAFPYFYKGEDRAVTLYARWEEERFENGEYPIWGYVLPQTGAFIEVDVLGSAITWFVFTAPADCYVKLCDGVDFGFRTSCYSDPFAYISNNGWQYMVYTDEYGNYFLEEGQTYYFQIISEYNFDVHAYFYVEYYNRLGVQIPASLVVSQDTTEIMISTVPNKKQDY